MLELTTFFPVFQLSHLCESFLKWIMLSRGCFLRKPHLFRPKGCGGVHRLNKWVNWKEWESVAGGNLMNGWCLQWVPSVGQEDNPSKASPEEFPCLTTSQHMRFVLLFDALLGCGSVIQIINQKKGSKLYLLKLMKCIKISVQWKDTEILRPLNPITALQTSCSFLYLCLFIWMPALMIEAINYTSPVMSYELLGNDQKLKYLFSVLLLLFWFGQCGFWRIVFASLSVIHPCDCLMKYPAIQLYPAETGNVEMVHFANWARRYWFQAVKIVILLKIAYFCGYLSPYCFFFFFL